MTEERFDIKSGWEALRAWLMVGRRAERLLLVLILLVGGYLRLSHINWDLGTHIHPDERFLTMVSDALKLPKSLPEFFDSTKSPMSPYNTGYDFFVYGTLPIFIVRVAAEFLNKLNQAAQIWTQAGGGIINLIGYDGVHFVGRALSGLFDLACVWLTYIVGRRLYSRRVGVLAAALYAFAVLPLQQSHFYTVDTFGTFFALLTFYFCVRVAQGADPERAGGGWASYVALGASLGASVACRINLAPLAAIALFAAGMRAWDDWHSMDAVRGGSGATRTWLSTLIQATLFRVVLMLLVTVAVFRIAQPYAFGGSTLLDFAFASKWLNNMKSISQQMSGAADTPPGIQWASRTPFVFPFVNMVVWGMGVPWGLTAWAGWAVAFFQIVRSLARPATVKAIKNHLLPVAWIGGMFLWQGLQYVQSMRYLLPIYPLMAVMAAWLLWWLVAKAAGWKLSALRPQPSAVSDQPSVVSDQASVISRQLSAASYRLRGLFDRWPAAGRSGLARRAAYGLLAFVLIGTMLWGWGFLAIYRRPLSRVSASRWIYENIPADSKIANEHWDDGLPLSIDGKTGFKPYGPYEGLKSSDGGAIQMYWEDNPEKREKLYQWLNEADYLVLSSNRLWGSIPRIPMRYPLATLYYRLLFDGELGFEQVAHFTSFPTILGVQFNDTRAEEAFSVYDHPEVYIFRKTPAYSEELARSYFDAVDLENTIQMWPKQVSAAPTALMYTEQQAAAQEAGGTWTAIFGLRSLVNRSPILSVVVWLLLLEVLGLAAFPIAFVALRGLSDRGFGVSKILGVLLLAWLSWIGPSLKLVPYTAWWIALSLGIIIGVSAVLARRRGRSMLQFMRERRALLFTEEGVFLVLFLLFLLIRIGNPDLWHPARGGEKPMDFAYLNAIIKSTTFPPFDPWHSGAFMSYYYFGFVIVGTLVKLTGIVPWVAYNLAVPALFALTGLGAFAVAFNLADGNPVSRRPRDERPEALDGEAPPREGDRRGDEPMAVPSLLAGLGATFFVAIVGNLGNVKLLVDQLSQHSTLAVKSGIPGFAKLLRVLTGAVGWLTGKQPLTFPNDWWFWNASRVIPETINEFPFFTFTYADLHAHMIALPLTLLGLAVAVALVRLAPRLPFGSKAEAGQEVEPSPWCVTLPELLPLVLFGLVCGALRATNTWDFPTYLLVGLAAVTVTEASRRLRLPFPADLDQRLSFLFRSVVSVIWRTLIIVVAATLAFYPYTKNYATAYAGLQRWSDLTTTLPDYLTVHGFFLALITIYLISELAAQLRDEAMPDWLFAGLPVVAAVVVALMVAGWALDAHIWLIALPLAALAVVLALATDIPAARRLALILIALGLAITMGVEVVRLRDDIGRMNTVFKFYMQAWTLFGIGSAFGLASWSERARQGWSQGWRRLAWVVTLVLFAGVMIYPATAARAKIRDRFSAAASPRGLDGMAYMDKAQYADNNRDMNLAGDKDAMLWMLSNVQGSPVILEGNTPNYRWGSRFSIYTGLPAVQGWDWHQKQQRSIVPQAEVDRRLAHVKEMYTTTDLPRAQALLDHYNVSYIIMGELERAYYPPEGLAKFNTMTSQGYLRVAYTGPSVIIYQVVDRGTQVRQAAGASIGPRPVPTPTPGAGSDLPAAKSDKSPVLPGSEPFESPQK